MDSFSARFFAFFHRAKLPASALLDAIAFAYGFWVDEIADKIQALQNSLYCGQERLRAKSRYQENCVSHLTLQEVIDRINQIYSSVGRRRGAIQIGHLLRQTETTALHRIGIYEGEHSNSGGRGWFNGRSDLTESGRSILIRLTFTPRTQGLSSILQGALANRGTHSKFRMC